MQGKHGKFTGGKVCGIVGLALSVIVVVLSAVFAVALLNMPWEESYDADTNTYSWSTGGMIDDDPIRAGSATDGSTADVSTDEQACKQLVSERFATLKNKDEAVVAALAQSYDDYLHESLLFHADEIGVDTTEIANWLLTDFDCTIEAAYVEDDGTATVYVDARLRDFYALNNAFYQQLDDCFQSEEGSVLAYDEAMG